MDGVPVLRVPLYPSHDRNPIRRIANYASFALSAAVLGTVLARPTDVVYVYHPPPTVGAAAALFRRVRGAPIVYHIADMWPESAIESGMFGSGLVKRSAGAILSTYCNWVYAQCAAITVLSPGFKRLLVERGVPANMIHVVYNWAHDDLFVPGPRDEALARELGLAGKFNIVYAGNFGAFQGLETVIRAAASVRDVPDLQVVLAGSGVEEARLRSLASELGASNVRFLEQRPLQQMPALNALADVLLVHLRDLPFFRTTIPGKTQVNMASGRPILMAVPGDAAEVIQRAAAGLTVPPEDPDAMARAFMTLKSMPRDERERFGAQARSFYVREMSLRAGTDRMVDLFETVRRDRCRARAEHLPIDRTRSTSVV
jgi:glycosyltransferase involved in cell wall biosynthesis